MSEPSSALALPDTAGPIELLSALEASGHATDVSLDLSDPGMSFDRWEALGRVLGEIDRRSRWYLGDWLLFGEALYGETAYDAVEGATVDRYDLGRRVTGLDYQTLNNYASVCSRVPRERRRKELSFRAHEAVAKLEADEQTEWLQKAVENGWKSDQLRAEIKAANGGGGTGGGGGGAPLAVQTECEQIRFAAQAILDHAQPSEDPRNELVPKEAMAQLRAAFDID